MVTTWRCRWCNRRMLPHEYACVCPHCDVDCSKCQCAMCARQMPTPDVTA